MPTPNRELSQFGSFVEVNDTTQKISIGTTITQFTADSLNVIGVSTLGSVRISSGIVTAITGVVTYYGDGSKLSGIATGGGGSVSESYWNQNSTGIHTLSNVGVGTTNATSRFTVTGDSIFLGVVTATAFVGDGSGLTGIATGGGGSVSYWNQNSTGIHTLSNVGIGTTNAVSAISIGSTGGIKFGGTNIKIGDENTGRSITSANHNNLFGYSAGQNLTVGHHNNIFGRCAGFGNTSGSYNNFFSTNAGRCNTSGCYNNLFGINSGFCNTIGNSNNFFGLNAGRYNTTGGCNNFFGQNAGCSNITGSENTVIGNNRNTPILNGSNQLVIGAGNTDWIVGNSSFNVGIGTTNPTSKLHVIGDTRVSGVITATTVVGNLTGNVTGTATTATVAQGLTGTPNITVGIVTATTVVGNLTGNVTGTATTATVAQGLTGTPNINAGVITATTFIGNLTGNVTGTATTATVSRGLTGTPNITVGVVTASSFIGNLTGTSTTATNLIGGIASIAQLQVTGISTFTNGSVFIGSGTSTGTASQRLQVTGGGYVSGNFGVGTTNPTSNLHITGNARISGIVTANSISFPDADASNWVALQGPSTVTSNLTLTLPSVDGTLNQVLSTNGSGILSFISTLSGVSIQVFTSGSGTYTPSSGRSNFLVIATGGGGGGGGTTSAGSAGTSTTFTPAGIGTALSAGGGDGGTSVNSLANGSKGISAINSTGGQINLVVPGGAIAWQGSAPGGYGFLRGSGGFSASQNSRFTQGGDAGGTAIRLYNSTEMGATASYSIGTGGSGGASFGDNGISGCVFILEF